MLTMEEFREANERYEEQRRREPHIVEARYDKKLHRIVLVLSSKAWFCFSPDDTQGLTGATQSQLEEIEITPMADAVDFPQLDVQCSLPGMLQGHFGSRTWMAQHLGAAGGRATSQAKTTAARANGKLGGRPRKNAA